MHTPAATSSRRALPIAAILFIVSTAALASCAANGSTSPDSAPSSSGSDPMTYPSAQAAFAAIAGEWRLEAIAAEPYTTLMPKGTITRRPGMTIAPANNVDAAVSGFAGVNRYATHLELSKLPSGGFHLYPANLTRMAGPPDAMKLEDRFTAALGNVKTFTVVGGRLKLRDDAGNTLLEFSKVTQ